MIILLYINLYVLNLIYLYIYIIHNYAGFIAGVFVLLLCIIYTMYSKIIKRLYYVILYYIN